jgi:predicted O-methyltransferase YrrM
MRTTKEILEIMRPAGSLTDGFLLFLQHRVKPDFHVVEVGCFAGASSRMFSDHLKDGHLLCVDSWSEGYYNGQWNMKDIERTFDEFAKNAWNVTKIKMESTLAARNFEKNFFDMAYIDADHTYEGCKADILAWSPKVKPDGLVAGHDYSEAWPGVVRAVNEHFKAFAVFPDSTWCAEKKDMR